jgi:tRNA threonylcarbamoyladenosine biosynthesis protein TsaE
VTRVEAGGRGGTHGAAHPGDRRVSGSPDATVALGAALAPALAAGDVLVLEGPLGAGKTRFVTGLAQGLSAAARVRSPSFTLINEYAGKVALLHVDLYRLDSAEAGTLGLEELGERGVLAVEWGERMPHGLRADALTLTFELVTEQRRAITARAGSGRGLALLEHWRRLPAAPVPEAAPAAGEGTRSSAARPGGSVAGRGGGGA